MVSVATSNDVFTNTALSCLEGENTSASRLKNPFFLGVVINESRLVIDPMLYPLLGNHRILFGNDFFDFRSREKAVVCLT